MVDSAEHFQQCAESLLLRNRGLSPLAVTVLPVPLGGRAAATCPFWKLDSNVSMMEPAKDRMRNNVSEPPDVEQRGEFSGQEGEQQRLGGPFGDVFIRAKFQAQGQTGSF
jgi:hypothetical protein